MNFVPKLYFKTIKQTGNQRLIFVSGSMLSLLYLTMLIFGSPFLSLFWEIVSGGKEWFECMLFCLYLLFWGLVIFYIPFLIFVFIKYLIVKPIKFIVDGYSEDKRSKK